MKRVSFFVWICLLTSIILSACGSSETERNVTTTEVAIQIEVTQTTQTPALASTVTSTPPPPTPTLTPTNTPTPTPIPTATPIAGLGVPISGGRWQVTLTDARQETKLTTGGFLDKTTYTPKQAGYAFLVIDFNFRSLDPASPVAGVPSQAITAISADGQILTPIGIGGFITNNYVCVEDCDYILKPANHRLAFLVKQEVINQPWRLQVPDVPSLPFSVNEKAAYPFVTEVGQELGVLPSGCQLEALTSLDRVGVLSYTYWNKDNLTLASLAADGSQATPICAGIASAYFQRAIDGAALLRLGSLQGWSNLYAIEPNGRVFVLVKNSPTIWAEFDPTGRYIFFTATELGEKGQEALYVFDRETIATTQVKRGEWVNFNFFDDGRLLVSVNPPSGDTQYYLGQADNLALEPFQLPEGIYTSDIASDGEHLVYTDLDDNGSDYHLFMAEFDGSKALKLVTAQDWVSGELAPNGQFILIEIPEGAQKNQEQEPSHKAELRRLTSDDSWTILQGGGSLSFSFSADSRYALVYNSVEAEDIKMPDQRTLFIVNTANGKVVAEIDRVINAVFSPDNTQLAYTVREADGHPAMYILSLESLATQPLGEGVVNNWWPSGPDSVTLRSTPTVTATRKADTAGQTGDTLVPTKTPTPTHTATPIPATPTPPPATPTPSRQWVLVADSAADFPGPIQSRKWWYLWSKGRNNFIWQDMAEGPECYHAPNEMTLEICRDRMKVDIRSRGDAALQWKAPQGGTYRFEWSSNEVDGDTVLWFYKHLDFVGSQGPGSELPYSAIVEDVIDWELFFWVPQYDTPYQVKVYKLQE